MLGFGRRKKKKQGEKSSEAESGPTKDALDDSVSSEADVQGGSPSAEGSLQAENSLPAEGSIQAEGLEPAKGSEQVNHAEDEASSESDSPEAVTSESEAGQSEDAPERKGFFSRVRKGLGKTRAGFTEGLGNLLLGEKVIDVDIVDEIEMQLIMADVGVDATRKIVASLTEKIGRRELLNSKALYKALQRELEKLLLPRQEALQIDASKKPYVILVVGVNGVGKTTTIGKIAQHLKNEGNTVMLAAGDTYRAAAVEQLQVWGERNDVPVVAQHTGADSASVIFDALQAAQARQADVLIADTAGRLHTKTNLNYGLD